MGTAVAAGVESRDRNARVRVDISTRRKAAGQQSASAIMLVNAGCFSRLAPLHCQRKDSAPVIELSPRSAHGNREDGKYLAQWQAHPVG